MQVTIEFPIIADPTREIAVKYGMLDPGHKDKEGLPLTCRAVFIIGGTLTQLGNCVPCCPRHGTLSPLDLGHRMQADAPWQSLRSQSLK